METPKIIWSPKAKKQYSEILLFGAENNNSVKYALLLNEKVENLLDSLKSFPKIGRVYAQEEGIRRLIILSHYSLYYRVLEEFSEIHILAFKDNRSNPEDLVF